MEVTTASSPPERPGKTSVWTSRRAPGKYDASASVAAGTEPASTGVCTLDEVLAAFWQAYKHLFPPHSLAAQTPGGSLVISWSVVDDPHARYPYAAPVMLRFDETLMELMANSDARQRARIAQNHELTLREGLRGYDPFSRFPNARVINIG
jgi:hypothetical protein